MRPRDHGFGTLYLVRFARLQRHLFPDGLSLALMVLLVALCGVEQFLVFKVGMLSGEFYKVLGGKDFHEFIFTTLYGLGMIVAMVIVKSVRVFNTKVLEVQWRKSLTSFLHKKYFAECLYYDVNVINNDNLDNPDQRIASDGSTLVTLYSSVISDLIVVPFAIGYYGYSAYTRTGWVGPTSMFGLFCLSSAINKLLMSPISRLTVKKEKLEGNFRFKHVFVRVNAESLAFSGTSAEELEHAELDTKLNRLCDTQQSLFLRQLFLNLATNGFDYLGSIASYVSIAIPIFAGYYDYLKPEELSQAISENAFVCMNLVYQFSKLVDMASKVSQMAGVTHRVAEFLEAPGTVWKPNANPRCPETEGDLVCGVRHLDVFTPGGKRLLVSDLSFDVRRGESLLITGKSSSGKTSILRIVKGLWPVARSGGGGGGDRQPPVTFYTERDEVYYVPQRPYLSDVKDCSLRSILAYPETPTASLEETRWMVSMLEWLEVTPLLERVGGSLDANPEVASPGFAWSEDLSPGEMQLLSFVRMFYHSPSIAILDEATSALSMDVEQMLYAECVARGMTLISVAHRESVRKFHRKNIVIGAEATWTIVDVVDESFAPSAHPPPPPPPTLPQRSLL